MAEQVFWMLLPAIFGCSKRHVAIINVVSSCSNKENKGNFGFLKIDATNAVFVGFGGPPENADSSYLSQTDSLSYGAFVQVLGTFDQKMEPTTLSAASSKPAG